MVYWVEIVKNQAYQGIIQTLQLERWAKNT